MIINGSVHLNKRFSSIILLVSFYQFLMAKAKKTLTFKDSNIFLKKIMKNKKKIKIRILTDIVNIYYNIFLF